jgi:hypothetical protein
MSGTIEPGLNNPATLEVSEVALSRAALKTLGETPGLGCGPLSPLARISPPDGPADRSALLAGLTSLDGPLVALVPALLDPHCTITLLFGDGGTARIGQYLWPEASGQGPGFRIAVEAEELRCSGPLSAEQVWLSCLDLLSVNSLAEVSPLQMIMDLEQFWAMLTLLDAYRMALLRRRLDRQSGDPAGVSSAGLAEAWQTGLAVLDPGWSVSLFALLRPDLIPERFVERVAEAVERMETAGLLTKLPGEPGDPLGDVYLFGEGLERLCQAVLAGARHVGLSVERLRAVNEIELTSFGGWRTPGGFWLADLSAIPLRGSGTVKVTLLGGPAVSALIESTLGVRPDLGAEENTPARTLTNGPYARQTLIEALPALPTETASPQ